jgi:diguanylate cyclase (GGDEF)-like protein/PAS domain S-box-containing protein
VKPNAAIARYSGLSSAEEVSLVVGRSDNAVVICDSQANITYINSGFASMLGYSLEEVAGRRPSDFLSGPHTDQQTLQYIRSRIASRESYRAEILIYTKAGRPMWISAVVNPICDAAGTLTHILGVYTDITQSKIHEVLHRKVLDAMVNECPIQEVMNLVCHEVEKILPEVTVSVIGVDAQGRLRPLAAPGLPESLSAFIDGLECGPMVGACGTAAWSGLPVITPDIATDPRWEPYKAPFLSLGLRACWSSPIKANDGRVLGTFALYYHERREPDASHVRVVDLCLHLCALALERERTKAHVHRLAYYDTLTGLPNRVLFSGKAEQILLAAAHADSPAAFMFIDIDRFKRVNDTQGHSAGDSLLSEIAQRLTLELRSVDIVARLAGDEFAIVVPDCTADQAADLADRILIRLSEPATAGRMSFNPSASIGIAVFPSDGWDVDTLLRHSDIAMYRAKSEGGGRIVFYSGEMNRAMQERLALESALRDALRAGELQLHYQPQIDSTGSLRLHGVEALLRWQHPEIGEISPSTFVPMAEECGLIDELGRWTLERACRQLADWRKRNVPVPRVSINLSAINFERLDLPDYISYLIRTCGLQPGDLVVEVTESVMLAQKPSVLANIDAIHRLGIQLSIDDFGTGYSSLSHIHRLPISEIKLDMSFVRDLETSESARALTTSILRIGESLRLTVVAEGVETQAQRDLLAGLNCHVLQGYLFSCPLSPTSLERWIIDTPGIRPPH